MVPYQFQAPQFPQATLDATSGEALATVANAFNKVIETVKWVAGQIFDAAALAVSIPARYLGSKLFVFWNTSAYQTYITPLTKEEAKEFIVPASLCGCIHQVSEAHAKDFITPFNHWAMPPQFLGVTGDLPGNLERRSFCFYDPESHLKVMVAFNERGEAYVVFGALGCGLAEENNPFFTEEERRAQLISHVRDHLLDATMNLMGVRVSVYEQASTLTEMLLRSPALQGKKITLVGQSLGGSIAQYVGIKQQVPTICFNALQLGAGLQYDLGRDKIAQAGNYIRHVSAASDVVSDPRFGLVDKVISLLGVLRTPANFGKCYSIPTAYDSFRQTHDFILGSLMRYTSDGSYEVNQITGGINPRWNETTFQFEPAIVGERTIPGALPYHLREEYKRLANSPIDVKIQSAMKENILPHASLLHYASVEFGLQALTPYAGAPSEAVKWQLLHAASAHLKDDDTHTIHYGDWFGFSHLNEADLACLFNIVNSYQQYKVRCKRFDGTEDPNTVIFRSLAFDMRDHFLRLCFQDRAKAQIILNHLKCFPKRNPDLDKTVEMLDRTLNPYSYAPVFHPLVSRTGHTALTTLRESKILPMPTLYADPALEPPRSIKVWKIALESTIDSVGGISSVLKASGQAHKAMGLEEVYGIHPLYAHNKMKYDLVFKGVLRHEFNGKMVTSTLYKNKATKEYLVEPDPVYAAIFDVNSQKGVYGNFWYSSRDDRYAYMASAAAVAAATYCGKNGKKSVDVLQADAWHAGGAAFELMKTRLDGMREEVGLKRIKRVYLTHMLVADPYEQGSKSTAFLKRIGADTSHRRTVNLTKSGLTLSDANVFVSKGITADATSPDKNRHKGLQEATLSGGPAKVQGITNGIDAASFDVTNPNAYGIFSVKNNQYLTMQNEVKAQLWANGMIADPVKPLALYVGRFSHEKGISMLPSVVEEVKRQGGQIVIMGMLSDDDIISAQVVAELKALSQTPEYSGCLKVYSDRSDQMDAFKTPFDPNCKVKKGWLYRQAASVVVVPSFAEACGLVPMELQCAGAITVAPYHQGLPDMLVPAYAPDITGASFTLQGGANSVIYRDCYNGTQLQEAVGAAFFSYNSMSDHEKNEYMKRVHDHAIKTYDWVVYNPQGQIERGSAMEYSKLYHKLVHSSGIDTRVETLYQALERRRREKGMHIPLATAAACA